MHRTEHSFYVFFMGFLKIILSIFIIFLLKIIANNFGFNFKNLKKNILKFRICMFIIGVLYFIFKLIFGIFQENNIGYAKDVNGSGSNDSNNSGGSKFSFYAKLAFFAAMSVFFGGLTIYSF